MTTRWTASTPGRSRRRFGARRSTWSRSGARSPTAATARARRCRAAAAARASLAETGALLHALAGVNVGAKQAKLADLRRQQGRRLGRDPRGEAGRGLGGATNARPQDDRWLAEVPQPHSGPHYGRPTDNLAEEWECLDDRH